MTTPQAPYKRCPNCLADDMLMTCTDLGRTTTRDMVYRLRCYTCGYHPKWAPSQEGAIRRWQRAKRGKRKEEV